MSRKSIGASVFRVFFLSFVLSSSGAFGKPLAKKKKTPTAAPEKNGTPDKIPGSQAEDPSPFVTGILASILPGAGYYYLGDTTKAAYGMALAIPMIASRHITTPDYKSKQVKSHVSSAAYDLFGYTVFDSYQDALDISRDESIRNNLVVNHPHYSFRELFFAPVSIDNYQ